jgi:hypothetical protein
MDGRPRPVMSPYKQANERANLHSLQGEKRKEIKTALLKPQPRGVFLTREAPGALAILQDSLVGDAVHTVGGLHSRDPTTSKVLKLPALKMEDVDLILFETTPPQDKIFELLRETWMLAGLDTDLNDEDAPIPTVNTIHVMRHPKSANTKCINFVGDGTTGRHKTFRFESNNNYLYIEKNKAKGAVYLKLDFNSTGHKTRSIRECVLIFNGSSSLRVQQRKEDQPVVKLEKASWETQATVAGLTVGLLDECIAKQSEHASHLIAYLDEIFPASHPIPADGRGDNNAFSPDAYTPYHRAVLHNIYKLHCTFAYLRALAAVLLRDTSGYSTPTTF